MSKKNILKAIKHLFDTNTYNFMDIKSMDGRIYRVDALEVGSKVLEITEEGEIEVADGDIVLEDRHLIKVLGGEIIEIVKPEVEIDEEMEVVNEFFMDVELEDGTMIHIVTVVEGEINEGDIAVVRTEEGEVPLSEGEHILADGRRLTIGSEGMILGIVAPVEIEDETEEDFSSIVASFKSLLDTQKEITKSLNGINKEISKLKSEFKSFKGEPSAEPTETKIDFSKVNKEERLKFFSKK